MEEAAEEAAADAAEAHPPTGSSAFRALEPRETHPRTENQLTEGYAMGV